MLRKRARGQRDKEEIKDDKTLNKHSLIEKNIEKRQRTLFDMLMMKPLAARIADINERYGRYH